ncbi:hypothetical protein [Kamptonema formosum]|uniref:hypothetical protein n=1 Tax=Kamptonema formosum TaxID=331992 RepID=UPI000349BE59|nr:hypothetical protein [Oscillatoria sp. PCC 10802]
MNVKHPAHLKESAAAHSTQRRERQSRAQVISPFVRRRRASGGAVSLRKDCRPGRREMKNQPVERVCGEPYPILLKLAEKLKSEVAVCGQLDSAKIKLCRCVGSDVIEQRKRPESSGASG